MQSDSDLLVERLVAEFSWLLVSQSLYDVEDLRQEISLIHIKCKKNYDSNINSSFAKYFRSTVRNELYKVLKQPKVAVPRRMPEKSCQEPERLEDYIPGTLSWQEEFILDAYLNGSTFEAIAFGMELSKDAIRHMFRELIIKIQEANK